MTVRKERNKILKTSKPEREKILGQYLLYKVGAN